MNALMLFQSSQYYEGHRSDSDTEGCQTSRTSSWAWDFAGTGITTSATTWYAMFYVLNLLVVYCWLCVVLLLKTIAVCKSCCYSSHSFTYYKFTVCNTICWACVFADLQVLL